MTDAYLKKIEKYIEKNKKTKAPSMLKSKGLLAPSMQQQPTNKEKEQDDVVAEVAMFVMQIREKRMELRNGKKSIS